jgi:hypothetical protein
MPPVTKAKKTRGAKKAPAKKAAPPKETSPIVAAARGWFFRPTPLIITAFLISFVVLIPYLPYLLPDLAELEEYQFEMEQIEVTEPQGWVPAHLVEDILVRSDLPQQVSLLKPGLCRDVAIAFSVNPWVRTVESVRLTQKPALRAHLEYRQPVALVETNKGWLPIDIDGVLLPASDFTVDDIDRLPHISNVQSTPAGDAGDPWGGLLVASAAKIAAALTPQHNMEKYWNRFQLIAVVVPAIDEGVTTEEELIFELSTVGGSRIIWGKPPGADDLEPTVEQKIGRMEQYLSSYGKFDEPDGPYRVDIRLFDAISLSPIVRTIR